MRAHKWFRHSLGLKIAARDAAASENDREGNVMSFVRDMRERQIVSAPVPDRSALFGTILFAACAIALAGGSFAAWKWMAGAPSPAPVASAPVAVTPVAEAPTLKFGENRVGRAAAAPLLKSCIRGDVFEGFKDNPQALHSILMATQNAMRVAPGFAGREVSSAQIGEYWREMTGCVYQQDSAQLCDADNRAFAVEIASGFVRASTLIANNPPKTADAQAILSDNARVKAHMLAAVQARLRDGTLIAADFPLLQPTEIKSLLESVKPTGNACAKG